MDLITVKGRDILAKADVVICRFFSKQRTLDFVKKMKIQFSFHDSRGCSRSYEKANNEGKSVVRLDTGDPSMYGAIKAQMDELDKLIWNMKLFQELVLVLQRQQL